MKKKKQEKMYGRFAAFSDTERFFIANGIEDQAAEWTKHFEMSGATVDHYMHDLKLLVDLWKEINPNYPSEYVQEDQREEWLRLEKIDRKARKKYKTAIDGAGSRFRSATWLMTPEEKKEFFKPQKL